MQMRGQITTRPPNKDRQSRPALPLRRLQTEEPMNNLENIILYFCAFANGIGVGILIGRWKK
jgi:hypothetical protein